MSSGSPFERLVSLRGCAAVITGALLFGACARSPEPRTTLTVATRNSPTTYYEDREGQLAGLEYELVREFASDLGLEVEFVVMDGIGEILDAVDQERVDLAAAGLTRTEERAAAFLIGPEYQEIEEQLVCHPSAGVRDLGDLVGTEIRVIADSSYQETLAGLRQVESRLEWTSTAEESTEQLLMAVAEGRVDCTVADSNIVAMSRGLLPELRSPFALGDGEHLAWFVAESSRDLAEPLEAWFDAMRRSGRLQSLLNRYYWRPRDVERYDHTVFFRRVESRLPIFEGLFQDVDEATGVDWRLLAAVAYQESHWDPRAVSGTGVRGLMMLTTSTAMELGVDRLDPYESILGGARYLKGLIDRMPDSVSEADRTSLALAAYNVGYGHLRDARGLAAELGKDPDSWDDMREVLPLLSQPRYYRELRHGYARGNEPVIFVERIRGYRKLLEESFSRSRGIPPGILVSSATLGQ